ncbi:MAG TPA: tetratricopeptide repeat protein, partial [Fuerstia sp.]|nr:tetratricopeptide repeat protein [Fuerstiella sp.]
TEESERLYEQLLQDQDEISEQSPTQTVYGRSLLLLQAGRLDEAIGFIRTRRQDVPESERVPLDRIHAQVLLAMVDRLLRAPADTSEAALDLLKESISVAPQEQQAVIRIASISCSKLSAAAEADSLLVRMLAEGSFNASVYKFIGTEALRANQFQKARRNLETAKRLAPQDPMVLNNLALAAIRGPSPDYDYALSLVASVLQQLPNHPDALSTRAEILLAMERWEEADRDLQLALPDRPASQNIRRLLVLVNEKLGNQDLADRHRDILNQMQDKAE